MTTTWGKFTSLLNAFSTWLSDSFDQLLNWALSDHSTEENKKPADNTTKILDNVLFYGNYSIYGSNYQVNNTPWDKITEAVYAFGMVGNSLPDPDAVDYI